MSKVEELRAQILNDWWYENKDDRYEQIDSLIAAAREEGAEQERERIRKLATPIDDVAHQMSLAIPFTVLAPKESK